VLRFFAVTTVYSQGCTSLVSWDIIIRSFSHKNTYGEPKSMVLEVWTKSLGLCFGGYAQFFQSTRLQVFLVCMGFLNQSN
jgi:hypothetical protein